MLLLSPELQMFGNLSYEFCVACVRGLDDRGARLVSRRGKPSSFSLSLYSVFVIADSGDVKKLDDCFD